MHQQDDYSAVVEQCAEWLAAARRVLCITGAGLSAASGLPTYRGIGGLYEGSLTAEGFSIEQALSGEMLLRRPEITWKYLHQVVTACRGAGYNAAHKAIVDMEAYCDVCVLTQNIDGFHRAAGSSTVIEMHGHYETLSCTRCALQVDWDARHLSNIVPHCDACAAVLRPNVVLFGEMLPERALDTWYAEAEQGFDLVLSIGTTSVFPYISGPVLEAERRGIPTIEINPARTLISDAFSCRLSVSAAKALPDMVDCLANT